MKLVLDTNIFIPGLISPSGVSGRIIRAWKNEAIEIILSEELIKQLIKVLNYPKIAKILKWDKAKIRNYISTLRFMCDVVDISKIKIKVPSDANDNHVMATFIAGKTDYLISGDNDLLNLQKEYDIISPTEFKKRFLD